MEKLVLIDGHAILYRAFHALPPLTNSQGEPLGAVYGFCSMLLRVIQDLKPQHLAVAFDLPAPTFRQKLFKDYQAQRPQMADELSSQIEIMHQVLKAMKIPIFEKEGYEADDLLGTISAQAAKQNLEIIILTGDRDMLQLVDKNVKVLAPIKGITQMILYDEERVEEKYGIKPCQWVDSKALMGDPSDNYPGVSGIGPKGAAHLLKTYGSLEKIYQNLDKLPERQAKALRQDEKQVQLAKQLAQIITDAPIKFNAEKAEFEDFKNPKVENLFKELEFKSLWERIETGDKISAQKVVKKEKKKEAKDNQLSLLN